VDGLGNPVRLSLSQGNTHDCTMAIKVLSGLNLEGSVVLGDKAYGSAAIRSFITSEGASYCIPPQENISDPWNCDFFLYKERHVVECFFNLLKHFRGIATRYDKLARNFLSFVFLAASVIILR